MRLLKIALLAGAVFAVPVLAQGQTAPAPTNDDCLACHDDASATRSNGSPVAVPAQVFAGSVHAGLSCVDCHQDLAAQTDWPHKEDLAPVSCAGCHADPVAAYATSAHAQARKERPGSQAATCVDCHGMHDIKPSSDLTSRTHHLNLPETCGRCHGNVDIIRKEGIRIGNVLAAFQDSIHGRAISKSGLAVAPNCGDCHGSHDIQKRDVPSSHVFRANVPATCGKCHEGIHRDYSRGIHGSTLQNGVTAAPVCADCHSAHAISRTDVPGFWQSVIEECGTCHADKVETFRDTFHGQLTSLGFARVAQCADCHGAHDIRPKSDPASMIAPANLVRTCSQCHEGANENFVKYDPHADKHDKRRNPVFYYTAQAMTGLLTAVFAFFGIHTGLWGLRSLRERRRSS